MFPLTHAAAFTDDAAAVADASAIIAFAAALVAFVFTSPATVFVSVTNVGKAAIIASAFVIYVAGASVVRLGAAGNAVMVVILNLQFQLSKVSMQGAVFQY